MKTTILLLILTITISVKANNKGKYIKTGYRNYTYDNKNQCIQKASYNADNKLLSFVTYIHDEKGNKIETLKYMPDSSLVTRYIYLFKNGLRVKAIKANCITGKEEIRLFKYNNKKQCTLTTYTNKGIPVKSTKTTYTKDNQVNTYQYLNSQNIITKQTSYKYVYKNGKIITKSRLSPNGKTLTKSVYKYDKQGYKHIFYLNYVSPSKRKSKKRIYHFNKKGLNTYTDVFELQK